MKEFVKNLLRFRKALYLRKKSLKDPSKVKRAIELFERYFSFYPKATDANVRAYCTVHYDELMTLMPGKGCNSHDAWMKKLNQNFY